MTAGSLALLDASALGAASDTPEVLVSRDGDVQMDTAPTMRAGAGSPDVPVGYTVVSMFATNSVAIRCTVFWGAQWMRQGGAALVINIAW
jgi:hypothetical protein